MRCSAPAILSLALTGLLTGVPRPVHAQLSLGAAQRTAREVSSELLAARESNAAAAARARQAAGFANPTLSYGREQTSRGLQSNAQNIAQLEQVVEIAGQRGARMSVARLRVAASVERLAAAELQLNFDVARAFALAITADDRLRIAEQGANAFAEAQRVSDARLADGDISGYAARRLRLESARFAAVRSAAALERRAARSALASLLGLGGRVGDTLTLARDASDDVFAPRVLGLDSLMALAVRQRAELRIAMLEAETLEAEARLVGRERIPTPTLSLGYKGERVADPQLGSLTGFSGYVAGFSIPLPILDRRQASVDAASGDARAARATIEAVRRRVQREVVEAYDALTAVEEQQALLAPHLGDESRAAMRAVQLAYAEGEISLVEWLDAVRAYQDAELTALTLQAEAATRRAALDRVVGARLPSPVSLRR